MGRMREDESTQLYRHFDASGRLLYVGISLSAISRLSQHSGDSHWFGDIANVTVERFETRRDALHAEADAIASEDPLYNRAPITLAERPDHIRRRPIAARAENRLTAKRVAGLTEPGAYQDGGGLWLDIDECGRRYWRWRYSRAGRRRTMSLGPADEVTLAEARAERDRLRIVRRKGHDPIEYRRAEKANALRPEPRNKRR